MKNYPQNNRRRDALRGVYLTLVVTTAGLVPGCAGNALGRSSPSVAQPVAASIPLRSTLDRLWEAHGGLDKWRSFRTVALKFSVDGDPPGLAVPWERVSFRLEDWNLLTVGEGSAEDVVDLAHFRLRNKDEEVFDYYLRTARMCFQLPLAIAHSDWELRRDIMEPLVEEEPYGFWAIPLGIPSPHLAYYLLPDQKTGLLKTAYYQVGHPRFAGKIFAAEFRDYQPIDGLMVATKIVHRLAGESKKKGQEKVRPDDPFESSKVSFKIADAADGSSDTLAAPLLWILRYDDITFK